MINKEVTNMNKKEVLEIRKQFSPENCAITRICGCYVDHEKEKKMEMKKAFLSLPEEEAFKYFDIFKHTLSGTIGKNLINMEFPLDQELNGGTQEFLMKLKNSKLQDDLLLEEFYDKVVESYEYGENYYIILIWRWKMHPTLYTNTSSAVSARSILQKPDSHTMHRQITSKTASATGS